MSVALRVIFDEKKCDGKKYELYSQEYITLSVHMKCESDFFGDCNNNGTLNVWSSTSSWLYKKYVKIVKGKY